MREEKRDGRVQQEPAQAGVGRHDDMRRTLLTLCAVGVVLIVAVLVQLSQLPWQVSCVLVATLVVWPLGLWLCPHTVKTAQGRAWVYTRRADGRFVRVLRMGGVYQSATYLGAHWAEPVFAYHRAFDTVFDADDALRAVSGHGVGRVLALGGGGFAWPKHALITHPELTMTVVELDPAMIDAAHRWFYVNRLETVVGKRLRVVEDDGRAYLDDHAQEVAEPLPVPVHEVPTTLPTSALDDASEHNQGLLECTPDAHAQSYAPHRFDAIVNDTFVGDEPVYCLATVEAAQAAKACLVPGGLYATNVVSRADGSDLSLLCDEVATLRQVFRHVHVIPAEDETYGGEDNYLVIATDLDVTFSDAVPYDDDFLGTPLYDVAES